MQPCLKNQVYYPELTSGKDVGAQHLSTHYLHQLAADEHTVFTCRVEKKDPVTPFSRYSLRLHPRMLHEQSLLVHLDKT